MAATVIGLDHGQRMDGVYAVQRHFYDATRKYYLLGRDLTIDALGADGGRHVLEIGCGTARNLVRTARRFPDAQLYGIDISAQMLKSARANLARTRLGERVRLARGDAADFDPGQLFGRTHFDRIMFSYTLSMVPDWRGALAMASRLLDEDGELHIVDFGMQERLPGWFGRGLEAWLAKFHVELRDELVLACSCLARSSNLGMHFQPLYGDYARRIVLTRGA